MNRLHCPIAVSYLCTSLRYNIFLLSQVQEAAFHGKWKASSERAFRKSQSALNLTSLKEFSWSACECMMTSYVGPLVFCLSKWSCRLVPRAILAYFNRWSWYIWPEGRPQASGHTRTRCSTSAKSEELREPTVLSAGFGWVLRSGFSQVSNFIHWVGSLGTLLWVLDSYLRDPFVNPQVFYALLPCVVQNSNDSFWHLKTTEILNFLFRYLLYCIFLCFEREHWKIFSFITHAPGHQLVEEFAGLLKRIDGICK